MASTTFTRCLGGSALVISALITAGCAVIAPITPEAAVVQRASAYWKARQAGQIDKVYALTAPSFRQVHTLDQFRQQFGAATTVKQVEVAHVTCESEKCVVRLKLGVSPALPGLKIGTVDTYLDEIWLLEDGQWWRFQEL